MEKKRDFSLKSLAISKPSNNTPKNSQFKEEKLKMISKSKSPEKTRKSLVADNKMEMFLSDLKEVSKKENENTKEILLKLDKESAGMKDNKLKKMNLDNIVFSKKEMQNYTNEYNENVSKFYTYSQSGKDYFSKNLTKGMKEL